MEGSGGVRLTWPDLPRVVRRGVEELVGAPVVHAASQVGGFSPGSADRVITATGTRAFVKAVSSAQNAESPGIHRREASVTGALPAGLPAPQLIGCIDVDGWVTLVLSDVDGRTPRLPWHPTELAEVLDALDALAVATTPCPVPDIPTVAESLGPHLGGADRLAADHAAVPGLGTLRRLAGHARTLCSGDTLVHLDLRADNVLLTEHGAVLVDWPWACRGPAWLDTLLLLVEVDRYGGHDVDGLLAALPATREVDPEDLTAVLAGLVGYFLDMARRPPPPGLPALRRFQRVQGEALLAWVRRRHGELT